MDDLFDTLSDSEIADTCALADGTLPEARRAEVEESVRHSPELTALLGRQRRALAASAALAAEPVPDSLRFAVDGLRPRAVRRRRLGWIISAAGVAAAVLVVFFVLSSSGVFGGPTVAAAADFALGKPGGPAPGPAAAGTLDVERRRRRLPRLESLSRLAAGRSGPRQGARSSRRRRSSTGRATGASATPSSTGPRCRARTTPPPRRSQASSTRPCPMYGEQVVTWQKGGHTCVLIGQLSPAELVDLASSTSTY